MYIDELPVGQQKQNFMVEEFPPDFDPQQFDKVDLPLKQRIKSKVWKVRLQAYEELANEQEIEYECILQITQDIHVQCQEKALQIALKYFEQHHQLESSQQKEIIKVLIEKVLIQQKLKQNGYQLAIILFPYCKQAIFEIIIAELTHKNPKIVQATISLLLELLQQYGVKKLDNLKPFFPILSKLTEAQQTTIKVDAISFYKEVTRWFGKNIEAFFSGLNEKLQQELKKIAETITEVQKAPSQDGDFETGNQQLYDLAEAVEVFPKFTDSWCEKVFQLEKWQEKKEQLENLQKACSVTKMIPSPNVYSIVQLLKKLINEQNIAICIMSIKIAGLLANGLRKNFGQYVKILIQPLFARLKDKKQSIVDDTIISLKKFFHCCTLDDLFEEIKALLDDKASSPKLNAFLLVEYCLDEITKDKLVKLHCIKQLVPICKKLSDDGNAEVRSKAIMLLAKVSVQLYNGSMARQIQRETNLQSIKPKLTFILKELKLYKAIVQKSNVHRNQLNNKIKKISNKINKSLLQNQKLLIKLSRNPQYNNKVIRKAQDLKYQSTMTTNQVEVFLKQYKTKNKDMNELGNILLTINQQSKQILTFIMDYIVEKLGDQKQLCYQLFEKCFQSYKPNHISQLIISFKNAPTQVQLIEVLTLLLKYIPLSDKTIDQQLISEFLKGFQNQSNQKAKLLVIDCQNALKQLFEIKKVPSETKPAIPFSLTQFSDLQIERLKEQLKVPQIPQNLYDKLFSYNPQQNLAAASYVRQKIAQPAEFTEIFFKWGYLISWFKESIPLQTEIMMLFQHLTSQHKLTQLEHQIITYYIKMMILLYIRNGMPKLAQRTLPLLMNLLAESQKQITQIQQLAQFDEFDDVSNSQANQIIKQMQDKISEWNCNSQLQQKSILIYLMSFINKEDILKEKILEQRKPSIRLEGILTSNIDCQNKQELVQSSQKLLQKQLSDKIMTFPSCSQKKLLQQQNFNLQQNQSINSGNKNISSSQILNVKENEHDIILRSFNQMYYKFRETNCIENSQSFAEQIIFLLGALFNDECYDKMNEFLEKLIHILSSNHFYKSISYQQFYVIFDTLIFKMVEQSTKNNVKDGAQKCCYNLINSNLIKILNNQDLCNLYLAFLDILIKVKESDTQTKQFYVLVTKCLSKSADQLKGQFQWSQVQAILEKIHQYLSKSQQPQVNLEYTQYHNCLLNALKTTVVFFFNYNDGIKVYQFIMQNTNETSILRQWILEVQEKNNTHLIVDLAKYRRSRDTNFTQIVELLKIDFDKTVEQFVPIVRRQNINWKPLVQFLNSDQIKFIEQRLEQTSHMNILEKKVGELEKMLNQ
ncbi:unnamed protein product (macronuclear) [Paramecium tetraurelia]|uniref:TOG domain-containing protein n=1 Tax=Paramecium tetraurelia TaxID=5888 RepID=A0E623_PARTE|nr:uncharacterized protein GSPATT00003603001 [Paramecium tetraurelia]CAK90740.1 unnamed protein product [Paramecium tetraurelia]|eukprot:XP_001458137.1 hypothetical protein (macronuclear) [Paramecium tetraurelia strain d4-2]